MYSRYTGKSKNLFIDLRVPTTSKQYVLYVYATPLNSVSIEQTKEKNFANIIHMKFIEIFKDYYTKTSVFQNIFEIIITKQNLLRIFSGLLE